MLLLSTVSCSRKVHVVNSHTTLHQDSTSTVIDTTKKAVVTQQIETTYYGDTLTGNIYIPTSDTLIANEYIDSLESNGIKIMVGLKPFKDGFKAHVNAIAKPKETVSSARAYTIEKSGLTQKTTSKTEFDQSAKQKDTETTNELYKWLGLVLLGFGSLGLIAIIIFLYIKNIINGKSL